MTVPLPGMLVVPVQRLGLAPAGLLVSAKGALSQPLNEPRALTVWVLGSNVAVLMSTWKVTWTFADATSGTAMAVPSRRILERHCCVLLGVFWDFIGDSWSHFLNISMANS